MLGRGIEQGMRLREKKKSGFVGEKKIRFERKN